MNGIGDVLGIGGQTADVVLVLGDGAVPDPAFALDDRNAFQVGPLFRLVSEIASGGYGHFGRSGTLIDVID